MECEEVLLRLWEYLDRELGPEEAASVGRHLQSCSSCHPAYCCDRAFLALLARQRATCPAPRSLVMWVKKWSITRRV
jgi:anti-sigma factor (TIGR02949 family)